MMYHTPIRHFLLSALFFAVPATLCAQFEDDDYDD